MDAMAAMTPEHDEAKKHDRSPFPKNPWQKMGDAKRQRLDLESADASTPFLPKAAPIPMRYAPMPAEHEDVDLNPPKGHDTVSMTGIASLLRQEIQPMKSSMDQLTRNFRDFDARFSDFTSTVEDRLQRMEVHIGGTEVRVNKLEELCQQLQCASQDIPDNIQKEVELQMRHLHKERQEAGILMADKRCLAAVIGNLQGLYSLSYAQSRLMGSKAQFLPNFLRTRIAIWRLHLLRSAGINRGGHKVWATQDRPPVERAARNFCFGLKNPFQHVWGIPYVCMSWMVFRTLSA